MNTRDLQYFVALVELRNYTRVASQFHVSQPTVTQAIQRLEREFNGQLVEKQRGHRAMAITRAGQLLYQSARMVTHQLALTHQAIANSKLKQIRFGLPPIIGKLYISGLVRHCPPDLLARLKIVDLGSKSLLRQLKDGDIDIALLGSVTPVTAPGLFTDLVASRPFAVIVSTDHPLARRGAVAFREFKGDRFITYGQQYIHRTAFNAYCDYAQVRPRVTTYQMPNISWLKELVRQGLGVSLIVKDAVKDEPGIVPLTLTDQVPERFFISVATREGYVLTPDESHLVNLLKGLDFFQPGGELSKSLESSYNGND